MRGPQTWEATLITSYCKTRCRGMPENIRPLGDEVKIYFRMNFLVPRNAASLARLHASEEFTRRCVRRTRCTSELSGPYYNATWLTPERGGPFPGAAFHPSAVARRRRPSYRHRQRRSK